MPTSINIDETPLRPNVRPAPSPSKRGRITFFVDIEAPRGRSVTRNLSRVPDDFIPTPPPPPPQPPVEKSLATLIMSLNLSSRFYWETFVPLDPITADFFLQQFEVGVGGNIDVPGLDLSVDMETTAEAAISRAPIIVDLTLPQFTTNKTITFEPIDIGLSLPTLETEAKVETSLDIITVDLTVPALNTDIATNFEALSLSMSLPDAEIASDIYGELAVVNLSVAGTLDTGININLPVSMESAQDDDVATIGSPSLLLDAYSGAAAAYSVRKLSTSYTGPCLKVRRDDGVDTGTDIGFDSNGDLNTADIASHCGSDDGYVVTWYDQSGNNIDATQSTTADQPKIYDGATTATLLENGKPAPLFSGSQYLESSSTLTATLNSETIMTVCAANSTSFEMTAVVRYQGSGARRIYQPHYRTNPDIVLSWANTANYTHQSSLDTDQHLFTAYGGNPTSYAYMDGAGGTMTTQAGSNTSVVTIGAFQGGAAFDWRGTIQEHVVWHSDQHDDRTGIESDINTYYSIYP